MVVAVPLLVLMVVVVAALVVVRVVVALVVVVALAKAHGMDTALRQCEFEDRPVGKLSSMLHYL